MKAVLVWLQSILSESDGSGSWTRVQGALTWLAVVAAVAVSVWTGHDIQPGAQGLLVALLTAAGGTYALNRSGEVLESIRPSSSAPTGSQSQKEGV